MRAVTRNWIVRSQAKVRTPKRYYPRRRSGWRRYWLIKLLGPVLAILALAIFREVDTSSPFAAPMVSAPRAGNTIAGRATVVDGDFIEIHRRRIRLDGIDAPETAQLCTDNAGKKYRCGAQASEALASHLT